MIEQKVKKNSFGQKYLNLGSINFFVVSTLLFIIIHNHIHIKYAFFSANELQGRPQADRNLLQQQAAPNTIKFSVGSPEVQDKGTQYYFPSLSPFSLYCFPFANSFIPPLLLYIH